MYRLRRFTGRDCRLWYSCRMSEPLRILVVDDDSVSREVLEMLLAHTGYAVETAESGEAALTMLSQKDVVLADLQMPGLRGSALAEALRTVCGGSVWVIAMSGSEAAAGDLAGYDGFLRKPFTMDQLQDKLRRMLEKESADAPQDQAAALTLDERTYERLSASMSAERLATLYEMFLGDTRRRIAEIRDAVEQGDAEECQRQAHAIKGSCGMVGALEVQMIATSFENNKLYAYSRESLETFLKACDRLEAVVAQHRSRSVRQ